MALEVKLGMAGPWADDFCEPADHYTTKIGGLPDWPIPESSIKSDLLICTLCRRRLSLVAQIYAPISLAEGNMAERTIYILCCSIAKCGSNPSSWRALRVQKCQLQDPMQEDDRNTCTEIPDGAAAASLQSKSLFEEGLSLDDMEEDDSDMDFEELGKALFAASSVASQSKNQSNLNFIPTKKNTITKPSERDGNMPVMPCFYIYFQKVKPCEITSFCNNYSSLSIKETKYFPSDNEDGEEWEDTYEYDIARGADRTFLKFKKQIDTYPHQCIRFSYGGCPLLASTNISKPAKCSICGSMRHYEMQLMPTLSCFLREATTGSSYTPDWSWLTLIVYTCSNNCCSSSCKMKSDNGSWIVAEEVVIIQEDEDYEVASQICA